MPLAGPQRARQREPALGMPGLQRQQRAEAFDRRREVAALPLEQTHEVEQLRLLGPLGEQAEVGGGRGLELAFHVQRAGAPQQVLVFLWRGDLGQAGLRGRDAPRVKGRAV